MANLCLDSLTSQLSFLGWFRSHSYLLMVICLFSAITVLSNQRKTAEWCSFLEGRGQNSHIHPPATPIFLLAGGKTAIFAPASLASVTAWRLGSSGVRSSGCGRGNNPSHRHHCHRFAITRCRRAPPSAARGVARFPLPHTLPLLIFRT